MIFTFLVAASGLLFSSYYIPQILEMQALGEAVTNSDKFANVHKGSELNFKLFAFSTLGLLILTLKKVLR
jgi:hypothetical protein